MRRRILVVPSVLGVWTLLMCVPAAAGQILKCKSESGQITYTQSACPPGTSPLDLPKDVPSETESSLKGSQAPRPLSARAAVLSRQSDSCVFEPLSNSCRQFEEVSRFCGNRQNWETADCAALRDLNASVVRSLRGAAATFRSQDRETCATGDRKACDRIACPANLMVSGTAADVRACSTHRKLESSSTWAQWNESKNGESWSGEYVCLKLVQLRNPIGELVSMRPTVVVETHMSGGAVLEGYTTNRLRKQVFATPSEAATKGCEAAIAQVEALGTEPR